MVTYEIQNPLPFFFFPSQLRLHLIQVKEKKNKNISRAHEIMKILRWLGEKEP